MSYPFLLSRRVKILMESGILFALDCHLELFASKVDLNLSLLVMFRLLLNSV